MRSTGLLTAFWAAWPLLAAGPACAGERPRSHPPLRTEPAPAKRPAAAGPAYYVDAVKGNDQNDGKVASPWRTLGHAVGRLRAGDTLYLRGGVYYENVRVSLPGEAHKPITIRAFPGERAVLDGGLREFFEAPDRAWLPFPGGGPGEFRSARTYPNLRHILGTFGDSMVGLQVYYHASDLRAANERWDWEDPARTKETDVKPVYCGPGLWYDAATGYVHARLAHTHLPGAANYRGETDPRKLPLVLAPFRTVPLHLDGARHIRFQDLVVRGGGYDTIVIDQSSDVEFDNVTVWSGTYGLRATGAQRLRLFRCGLHGGIPPWTYRTDSSLRSRPGRPYRDVTRLNTHALLVPESGREFSVYALPQNDDWEIAHCDFTDSSDGLYLGGVHGRFHHNLVWNMQDDGLYLSPMYPRYAARPAEVHVYQNYLGKCLTALAFGGPEKVNTDTVLIYRNVIDLRESVPTGRPSARAPQGAASAGHPMGDHGSPPWPAMRVYHNTVVMRERARQSDMALLNAATAERPRRLFNNVLLHLAALPPLRPADPEKAHADGNLYGSPKLAAKQATAYFERYRASPAFGLSKKVYPPGFESRSLAGDPKFAGLEQGAGVPAFALGADSPAVDAGAELPAGWPDPLRAQDRGRPDMGALPRGVKEFAVGRRARAD